MTDAELAEIRNRHIIDDRVDWDFNTEKFRDHTDRGRLLAEVHRLRAIERIHTNGYLAGRRDGREEWIKHTTRGLDLNTATMMGASIRALPIDLPPAQAGKENNNAK